MVNFLLINYPGYPATLREFYPDNGLANLAASLKEAGHNPYILDFANPDLITWFFPYRYKDEIYNIVNDIKMCQKKNIIPDKTIINKFYEVDDKINNYQKERINEFTDQQIIKKIKEFKPDIVGFKLWIGEGFVNSIRIAEIIKKNFPNIRIFAGGPQVDWFGENIYHLGFGECFEALAFGEGEETICAIADYVEGKTKISDIPNIIYNDNGNIKRTYTKRIENLKDIKRPIYDENVYYPMHDNKKIKIIMLDESRGCPNKCSFCIHPYKSGNFWRVRNPEDIVDDIEYLIKKYRTNIFRFAGSNPPPHLKRGIAQEIIKRRLKIKYGAFGHARGMTYDDYKLLKESGCVSLFFGVESGSQYILDKAMNKGNKVNEIKEALLMCKDAGIKAVASVIVPAPFDTEKTIEETYKLLAETRPSSVIVNIPGALPNTQWFENRDYYDFKIENIDSFFSRAMTYTIKNFYPPELWRDFVDYKLGELNVNKIVNTAAEFTKRLHNIGISTRVTDDLSVLVEALQINQDELINETWSYLSSGNQKGIEDTIIKINNSIRDSLNEN
ncbi:MAG: B12-binding domain-containing radical SAM protein [Candidatus Goldbacteria bacterium]|nr:B12-binding domain-containing radical SAM protein [Candidatus Goldiibacteriota bacterium]